MSESKLSSREQLLKDAYEGTLKPSKTTREDNKEILSQMSEDGKPTGRPLGKTTGLPILMAWSYIFQQNERAPSGKKLTDEQITDWMKKEFPGRDTEAFNRVNGVRYRYNKGAHTGGKVPKVLSTRYVPPLKKAAGLPASDSKASTTTAKGKSSGTSRKAGSAWRSTFSGKKKAAAATT